jgi:hypothetical protein
MLFLICHCAPALSVAEWVCAFIKAAEIPAGSALFMVSLILVPPGFTAVICWIEGGRLHLQ